MHDALQKEIATYEKRTPKSQVCSLRSVSRKDSWNCYSRFYQRYEGAQPSRSGSQSIADLPVHARSETSARIAPAADRGYAAADQMCRSKCCHPPL